MLTVFEFILKTYFYLSGSKDQSILLWAVWTVTSNLNVGMSYALSPLLTKLFDSIKNMFQVGGKSVVCKDVEQHVVILEDEAKFFKLLELLGIYSEKGSIIVFVDKQENADILLKDLMKASYSCMSLHGGLYDFTIFRVPLNYFNYAFSPFSK